MLHTKQGEGIACGGKALDENEISLDRDESVPCRPLYKRQGGDIGGGRGGEERGGRMQPA